MTPASEGCERITGLESILMRWMNLELSIWSKLSQRERQISYINAYIWNLE